MSAFFMKINIKAVGTLQYNKVKKYVTACLSNKRKTNKSEVSFTYHNHSATSQ